MWGIPHILCGALTLMWQIRHTLVGAFTPMWRICHTLVGAFTLMWRICHIPVVWALMTQKPDSRDSQSDPMCIPLESAILSLFRQYCYGIFRLL